jgi:FixJ family two-component response regulator
MKNVEQSAVAGSAGKSEARRISIVDDDASIREALKSLMRSVQFRVDAFASAEEFLASDRVHDTACLILDVYLPGMNGFELQSRLNAEQRAIPIIFITAHADETSRQRALRGGAVELLGKPVRRGPLFQAIQTALDPQ